MKEDLFVFSPDGKSTGSPAEAPSERRWLRIGDWVRIDEHKIVDANLNVGYYSCPNTIGAVFSLNIGKGSGDARCMEVGCHFIQKRVTLAELIRRS